MGFLDIFKRRESPLDIEVRGIRDRIIASAKAQSTILRVIPGQEIDVIYKKCNLINREQCPEAFIDIAIHLCSYPAELGSVIAVKFNEYEYKLHFKPFIYIIQAFTSSHTPSHHDFNHQKACEILSRLLFVNSNSMTDVRQLFLLPSGNSALLAMALKNIRDFSNPELVNAITN